MAFEMETGEQRLTTAKHPLLDFFYHTYHPDINVSSVPSAFGQSHSVQRGVQPGALTTHPRISG
jgi:hypothetical protein